MTQKRYCFLGIMILIVVAFLAACSDSIDNLAGVTPTTPPDSPELRAAQTQTVAVLLGSIPTPVVPPADVIAAARQKQYTFNFRVTADSGDQIEFVPPDKIHYITSGSEVIVIAGTAYIKNVDTWKKDENDQGAALVQRYTTMAGGQEKVSDPYYAGVDIVNGKPMWVYTYKGTIKTDTDLITDMYRIWVGVEDGLPYKVNWEAMGTPTILIYEYDPNIKVRIPDY